MSDDEKVFDDTTTRLAALASGLEKTLDPVKFVLITFSENDRSRVDYVSNGEVSDILRALRNTEDKLPRNDVEVEVDPFD